MGMGGGGSVEGRRWWRFGGGGRQMVRLSGVQQFWVGGCGEGVWEEGIQGVIPEPLLLWWNEDLISLSPDDAP